MPFPWYTWNCKSNYFQTLCNDASSIYAMIRSSISSQLINIPVLGTSLLSEWKSLCRSSTQALIELLHRFVNVYSRCVTQKFAANLKFNKICLRGHMSKPQYPFYSSLEYFFILTAFKLTITKPKSIHDNILFSKMFTISNIKISYVINFFAPGHPG